ncbi:hypothetical protein DFH11DRAFT_1686656 [Phellopilus nigrolimitatus]|nr:hypothetical protein DFH11DRAFT_1686656 [Phellopilus nigrolimitatus]
MPSPIRSPPPRTRTHSHSLSSSSADASATAPPNPKTAHDRHHAPARPPLRNNLDLEPNPFEQSFSVSSHSSLSSTSLSSLRNAATGEHPDAHAHASTHSRSHSSPSSDKKSPSAASSTTHASAHSRKSSLSNAVNNAPILPPLASITSPSDPSYAWSFSSSGLTNSLRSGPQPQPAVSVAASVHPPLFSFDPSGTFRTGLTPSTGLTPLVGGPVAFPPPSPNTAAFLAMVNSGTAANVAAATITPNTLNALTGVLQQHPGSAANGTSSAPAASAAPSAVPATSVAPSQMAAPAQSSYTNGTSAAPRYPTNTAYPIAHSGSNSNSQYGNSGSAANHAANGLFLLSQAHQELTKREEAKKQSMAQSTGQGQNQNQSQEEPATNGSASTKRSSKRKSDAAGGANKRAPSVAANTRSSASARHEESDDEGMQPPQSGGSSKGGHKKPETEEEKRKNFLERNRQAALKCRQRKKAWLQQLQAKVEFLANENERLTAALVSSREEISRLSQLVGGAGVGLSIAAQGVNVGVPLSVGMGVQQQQQVHAAHHAPYLAHQQPHHSVAVPVNLANGASPPMASKGTPLQHQHQQSPHSPASEGRSSRSSVNDTRDYGREAREVSNGRDYGRDMREREMNGHVHAHAPQAVTVNGRGYGY